MTGSRYISIFLTTALILSPMTTFAQGFDFGSDDEVTEETTDDGFEMGGDSSEGMTFETGEIAPLKDEKTRPTIAVLALPGPNMDASRRRDIEAKMNEVLKDIPENLYVGSDAVVESLESRGLADCVREPLCLGSVGVNNNVDQLLIAQVTKTPTGGETLTIDLFEAKDKLTLKYAKQEGLTSTSQMLDAVKPLLNNIFDVRTRRAASFAGPESNSIVAPIIAWGALGLAIGSAAAGGYFTYAAKKADDELKDKIDKKTITQVQANSDNEGVKNKQTLSYIFYGVAGGLAAVSAVFFFLDIGSDVSDEQDASIHNLYLNPIISSNGGGFSAGFSF